MVSTSLPKMSSLYLLAVATLTLSHPAPAHSSLMSEEVHVCAFNVRHIGRTKLSNSTITGWIVQAVHSCDVVLIQEYRDARQASLSTLWSRFNTTGNWGVSVSPRLGRSNRYQEQYLFFYNLDSVQLLTAYQTPDSEDAYDREPYSVEIRYNSATRREMRRIVLLGLHASPSDVYVEMTALAKTVRAVAARFTQADGVLAIGDFNADCTYLSMAEASQLEVFQTDSEFTDLLLQDTTVTTGTTCAYDRAVVYGSDVIVGQVSVLDFRSALQLTEADAQAVSDHFPIQVELL